MTLPRLLLTLTAALVPVAASAQPEARDVDRPPVQSISYQGNEVFRWLLHRAEIKPYTDEEITRLARPQNFRAGPDFSDGMVIVLGPTQFGTVPWMQPQQWVTTALKNGGAALVATKMPDALWFDGNLRRVQFTGRRVETPSHGNVFNGQSQSPFAEPVTGAFQTDPQWGLFGGDRPLLRVATNSPTTLAAPDNGQGVWPVLARLPNRTRFEGEDKVLASESRSFAAGGVGSYPGNNRPYRFLAVADPDVFCNGLMIGSDANGPTDNLEFADRVVTYLTQEDRQKQRTKCLLIVNGNVVRDYDQLSRLMRPPLPLPKLPPWEQLEPKLVDFGNQILDRVQENDVPNKLLVGPNPDEPGSRVRYLLAGLLVMAALWALVSLVRRVWGARQPTDLAPAPPGGRPPPPPGGAAGVFGRRGKELAARDNLLEPARAACRDLFDAVGRPPDPGPRLPRVVISDVVRKPDTLRQALRDLWAVAYGRPTPVTAMRWAALAPLVARALAAHRDGKWRFVEAEAWPDVSTRPRGEA